MALDFGTRWERELATITVADAERALAEGEFPPGSMGPKVESAGHFVEAGGRPRGDHRPRAAAAAVEGDDGTWVVGRSRGGPGVRVRVVRNRYVDSVRLMKVAADARSRDGVAAFEAVMGTPANLEALGLSCDAGPADVVLAVGRPGGRRSTRPRPRCPPPTSRSPRRSWRRGRWQASTRTWR